MAEDKKKSKRRKKRATGTEHGGTSHVLGQYDRVRQGGLRTDEEARDEDPPRIDEDEQARARHRRHHED